MPSLPMRGAWIEMISRRIPISISVRRSPCGERGLKCKFMAWRAVEVESLPMRGAWIEISIAGKRAGLEGGSRSPCGERGLKF